MKYKKKFIKIADFTKDKNKKTRTQKELLNYEICILFTVTFP